MPANEDKQIIYMPPTELIAYPKNIRKHTDSDLSIIRKSIIDYGFQDPVTVDPYMTIIEGHGRVMVAKDLIEDHIKVAVKTPTPHVMNNIPVIISDLEGTNADEYRLVHNKTGELAGYDMDMYDSVIDELVNTAEFDAEGYLFTVPDNPLDDVNDNDPVSIEDEPEAEIMDTNPAPEQEYKFIVICVNEDQMDEAVAKLSGMNLTIQKL